MFVQKKWCYLKIYPDLLMNWVGVIRKSCRSKLQKQIHKETIASICPQYMRCCKISVDLEPRVESWAVTDSGLNVFYGKYNWFRNLYLTHIRYWIQWEQLQGFASTCKIVNDSKKKSGYHIKPWIKDARMVLWYGERCPMVWGDWRILEKTFVVQKKIFGQNYKCWLGQT